MLAEIDSLEPSLVRAKSTVRLNSFILTLGGLTAGLLFCEAGLRLFKPGENVHTTATLGVYAPDRELGWVLKADLRAPRQWAGRTVLIRTDAQGHRISKLATSTVGPQIAFAGDSYVFGNEVNAEETFVELVGKASGKATVNLGVGGYALSQECLALRRFISQKTAVVHAFLVIYVGNDIEYGAYPSKSLSVDQHGYLRDGFPDTWTEARSFVLSHSRVMFYLHSVWRRFNPAALVSNAHDEMGNTKRWIYDDTAFSPDRLEQHRRVLGDLRDDTRVRGVPVTAVLMPERGQIYGSLNDFPNRMLSSLLSELGIPVVDLLPKMRSVAATASPLWHDINEGHLSPEGHRVVAEILVDRLRQYERHQDS